MIDEVDQKILFQSSDYSINFIDINSSGWAFSLINRDDVSCALLLVSSLNSSLV